MQPRLEHGDPIDIYHTGHERRVCLTVDWNLIPAFLVQPQLANVLVPCISMSSSSIGSDVSDRALQHQKTKDWLFLMKKSTMEKDPLFFF